MEGVTAVDNISFHISRAIWVRLFAERGVRQGVSVDGFFARREEGENNNTNNVEHMNAPIVMLLSPGSVKHPLLSCFLGARLQQFNTPYCHAYAPGSAKHKDTYPFEISKHCLTNLSILLVHDV